MAFLAQGWRQGPVIARALVLALVLTFGLSRVSPAHALEVQVLSASAYPRYAALFSPSMFQRTRLDCACAAFAYVGHVYNANVTLDTVEADYDRAFARTSQDWCRPGELEALFAAYQLPGQDPPRWSWPPRPLAIIYLHNGRGGGTHAIVVLQVTDQFVDYFDPYPYPGLASGDGLFRMRTADAQSLWDGWISVVAPKT